MAWPLVFSSMHPHSRVSGTSREKERERERERERDRKSDENNTVKYCAYESILIKVHANGIMLVPLLYREHRLLLFVVPYAQYFTVLLFFVQLLMTSVTLVSSLVLLCWKLCTAIAACHRLAYGWMQVQNTKVGWLQAREAIVR